MLAHYISVEALVLTISSFPSSRKVWLVIRINDDLKILKERKFRVEIEIPAIFKSLGIDFTWVSHCHGNVMLHRSEAKSWKQTSFCLIHTKLYLRENFFKKVPVWYSSRLHGRHVAENVEALKSCCFILKTNFILFLNHILFRKFWFSIKWLIIGQYSPILISGTLTDKYEIKRIYCTSCVLPKDHKSVLCSCLNKINPNRHFFLIF